MDNRTWHDQKPSHPPVSKAVIVAEEHAQIARKVYDDYWIDSVHSGVPVNYNEVNRLAAIANEADRRLEAARHDALNDCSCLPDLPDGRVNGGRGRVCDAHAAEDNDEIPFEGSGL